MHAARDRKALDVIAEGKGLPRPGKVRTAVFDAQFFDATKGKPVSPSPPAPLSTGEGSSTGDTFRVRTMWGWIAWSLGRK